MNQRNQKELGKKELLGLLVLSGLLGLYFYFEPNRWLAYSLAGAVVFLGLWSFVRFMAEQKRHQDWLKQENVIDLKAYKNQKASSQKESASTQEPSSNWVVLVSSCEQTRIGLAQSLLSSRGIACRVANRHSASILPSIQGLDMNLQVNEQDYKEAIKIMEEHDIEIYGSKTGIT